ncbi:hypothetical protein HK405_003997, partial [Cladochytrium tenue]
MWLVAEVEDFVTVETDATKRLMWIKGRANWKDPSETVVLLVDTLDECGSADARGDVFAVLLAKLGADLGWRDRYERADTALHCAAYEGHAKAARLLVELGADVHACNGDGDTPLHMAVKFRRTDVVAQLLSLGVRVVVASKSQQHLIHLAVEYGKPDAVRLLIDNGNEHIIWMLLWAAADPRAWDVANADGLWPVHAAYIHRLMDAVKILLVDGVADPACDVEIDDTPTRLHLPRTLTPPAAALRSRKAHVVATRLLLTYGAASDPTGTKCFSPQFLAAWGDHADV